MESEDIELQAEGEGVGEPLIEIDQYLASGVHIGTREKTGDMSPFIYRARSDGLFVLDIRQADTRIASAGKLIARYDPEDVYVVSARQYGQKPVEKFGEVTGVETNAGRFIPGTLTNPSFEHYTEPKLLVVTDPVADKQPLKESSSVGIPVIGICDTDNKTKNIDLIVPANNRGKKALGLLYWLLAREVLKAREGIEDEDFEVPIEEFESDLSEE